jgi:hypothetical protein
MNRVQDHLWKMSSGEQLLPRKRLIALLREHLLHAPDAPLRLEAASWLRFLLQAGFVPEPEEIFLTLVTASTQAARRARMKYVEYGNELASYLQMIFDSFWPFRYPYVTFTWEYFPANEVFYPLAPLLEEANIQEALIAIFAELPRLDDPEIAQHLLPVALAWSSHPDSERRRRVTNILARISHSRAQEALRRLQSDIDPIVRASAKRAAAYVQRA